MANARLLERLLPAMAAEAGISVAELRELMIPVDINTTADVSSAEDDVSDVEIGWEIPKSEAKTSDIDNLAFLACI